MEESRYMYWRVTLGPCMLYFACSFLMNVLNKAILTSYDWPFVLTMSIAQSAVAILILAFGRLLGLVSLPSLSRAILVDTLPISLITVANVVCGFAGLRLVSLPMYLVLRRLSTLTVMLFEFLLQGKVANVSVRRSLYLLALGGLVAGFFDLEYNPLGYGFTMAQNIMSASIFVLISKKTSANKSAYGTFGLLFINSIITLPLLVAVTALFTDELTAVHQFRHLGNPHFILLFAIACSMSFFYQLSVHMCTSRNSALSTSVTGNVKDLFSTLTGFLVFGTPANAANIVGLCISFGGAYRYAFLKIKIARAAKEGEAPPPPASPTKVSSIPLSPGRLTSPTRTPKKPNDTKKLKDA